MPLSRSASLSPRVPKLPDRPSGNATDKPRPKSENILRRLSKRLSATNTPSNPLSQSALEPSSSPSVPALQTPPLGPNRERALSAASRTAVTGPLSPASKPRHRHSKSDSKSSSTTIKPIHQQQHRLSLAFSMDSQSGSSSKDANAHLAFSKKRKSFLPPCTCPSCSPPSPDSLILAYEAHVKFPPPTPPSPRLRRSVSPPLPFTTPLSAHANLLHENKAGVDDIVRNLHSQPDLIKYRPKITREGVWDAIRTGSAEKEPAAPVVVGENGEELVEEKPEKLEAKGKMFEELCVRYWYGSNGNLVEIAHWITKRGFGTICHDPKTGKVSWGKVTEAEVANVLKAKGIEGGLGYGRGGEQKGWGEEAREMVHYARELGMGVDTVGEFLRDKGFGRVTGAEIRAELRELDEERRRQVLEKRMAEMKLDGKKWF